MRCDDISLTLPRMVDERDEVEPAVARHVESCLRCQAEVARYQKLVRALGDLQHQHVPAPGELLVETLAALDQGRSGIRLRVLLGNRTAVAGALGAVAAAGAATTIVLVARSRKRGLSLAS